VTFNAYEHDIGTCRGVLLELARKGVASGFDIKWDDIHLTLVNELSVPTETRLEAAHLAQQVSSDSHIAHLIGRAWRWSDWHPRLYSWFNSTHDHFMGEGDYEFYNTTANRVSAETSWVTKLKLTTRRERPDVSST
jgi:hypothetical protein